MKHPPITAANIKELISYDPLTGQMHRLPDGFPPRNNGNGYLRINVGARQYYVHRLAWLYMTGEWPKRHIDHKDLNPGNNRWENLREATPQQNHMNRPINRNNGTGFKGVNRDHNNKTNPWRARICINGKSVDLGGFATPEQAHARYIEEAVRLYGDYARGNK